MEKNSRGFDRLNFKDRYGKSCSLTKSSLATEDCIWLGVDDPDPKILARDADKFGIKVEEENGWVNFPLPKEVLIHTQMHLSVENVKLLIPILQRFVDTGELT